jgi:fumarate hydratase class I
MARPVTFPLGEAEARGLSVGDELLLSGRLFTGRVPALRWLLSEPRPALRARLEGAVLYHCAPVVEREPGGGHRIVAAGPTDSGRMEALQPAALEGYGLRAVLGKGGMGPATLAALQARGAVYLHAVGSLAVALAKCVARVVGAHGLPELGTAEAVWELEVKDFPAVVTMDAAGNSLHQLAAGDPTMLARRLMGAAPGSLDAGQRPPGSAPGSSG